MQFNHDNMTGALLAADLVNTNGMADPAAACALALEEHEIRGREHVASHLDELLSWAERLRPAFAEQDGAERCAVVNSLLADGASSGAYLTMHDGLDPHLHFAPDSDGLASRVRAVTAGGLAIFLAETRGARLGTCRRIGCDRAFVDLGRNATRRYCSTRCGNTDAVARHRARLQS